MTDLHNRFIKARKSIIRDYFSRLNDMQFKAVTAVNGPVMVLAGAGSGKTTVLVNRILNLIKFGDAYNSDAVPAFVDDAVLATAEAYAEGREAVADFDVLAVSPTKPWQILAITFTNKAANELKERISRAVSDGDAVHAGTFHSICAKILRFDGSNIGFTSDFTIYDTDDQKRLVKQIMKEQYIEEKIIPVRSVISEISSAKNQLIGPEEYSLQSSSDIRLSKISGVYTAYQKALKAANAMDFDDLIGNTVKLFEDCPEVLEKYQNKFKYIMVDEYQDTNHAQYVLVNLLARKNSNICVVGDDDQSIYRFRGATIENILNFEDDYPGATVIRLEQNYRSTQNILSAANAVISNNTARKGKNLWTDKGVGDKILINTVNDEQAEARFVADEILKYVREGGKFADNAVLYRTNAQSMNMENVFSRSGISYKIVGGHRFFERKEIKDIVSYLSVINNHNDSVRLRRIVNEPKRGIGDATISRAAEISEQLGVPLFEVFETASDYPVLSRSASKLMEFAKMINDLSESAETLSLHELLDITLDVSGYISALRAAGEEEQARIENIEELRTSIIQYENEEEAPSLLGFLENVALISDIDSYNEEDDSVILMTIHSAKGLEFDNVFLIGMEEGIFPGNQSIYGGEAEIEEERRLAYVCITRARKRLTISNAFSRMLYGQTNRNLPSRFLEEIPKELCEIKTSRAQMMGGGEHKFSGFGGSNQGFGGGMPAYRRENKPFTSFKDMAAQSVTKTKGQSSGTFKSGDRVRHKTFGDGMILSAVPMGNDTLLEIAFEEKGTKKIMQNFAKLEML